VHYRPGVNLPCSNTGTPDLEPIKGLLHHVLAAALSRSLPSRFKFIFFNDEHSIQFILQFSFPADSAKQSRNWLPGAISHSNRHYAPVTDIDAIDSSN
jgi:hypothetical protein